MLFQLGYAIKLEYAYQRYCRLTGWNARLSRQQYIDYRTWMDRFCE